MEGLSAFRHDAKNAGWLASLNDASQPAFAKIHANPGNRNRQTVRGVPVTDNWRSHRSWKNSKPSRPPRQSARRL